MMIWFRFFLATVCLVSCATQVYARPNAFVKYEVERVETGSDSENTLLLPYAFSTEGTGLVVGFGATVRGYHQEQMTLGATAFAGADSYAVLGGVWDYRFSRNERLYISAIGMLGYFPRNRAYSSPPNVFVPADETRPGSNDSSSDQFIEGAGVNDWFDIKLEYALPIGATRDVGMVNYRLAEGLLISEPSGGGAWNPRERGATVLMLRQYNRNQSYDVDEGTVGGRLHALELGMLYDNTDFTVNPSRGNTQYLSVHHDPAWFDSQDKWSFAEFAASQYFSLGDSRHASQRIIAINGWTGYSPSWQLQTDPEGGSRVINGPPFLEGANLGGFNRMRGYGQNRFHDKAALYTTFEYRYTLRYNPVRGVKWLHFLNLDWFQLVGFVEGGRVAPDYSAELLHDWKSDFGLALRAMAGGIIVRFDVARSDEGTNGWVMVGHPF